VSPPLVVAQDLVKDFPVGPAMLRAVSGVGIRIGPAETLGLVGESGSGKSTIGRMLAGLIPVTSGSIALFGETITGPDGMKRLARVRHRLQFVFQDPNGSLNPRMRVRDCIAEPMDIAARLSRGERREQVAELLAMVGLPTGAADRYPHEFSGGQRQRIGIARALALRPDFIVCDEPVSALDVSMQAQIVNLLLDLQDRFGLGYLFIAHDLAVVRNMSHTVAVMYAGCIVEAAPRRSLYAGPLHPYTQALLDAVPRPDPDRIRRPALSGEIPSVINRVPGCTFAARCPRAIPRCLVEVPPLREITPTHQAACHLV
jgi:oligopeptide/dipeptide ABC transporter ATP-binding protein